MGFVFQWITGLTCIGQLQVGLPSANQYWSMGSKKDEVSPSDVTLNMDSVKQVNSKPLRAKAFFG